MRWMQVSVCVAALALAPSGNPQTRGVPRSLEEVVRLALERNGEYLAVQQRLQEARGLLRQAGVRPNSTIEIEAAQGRVLGSRGEGDYTGGFFQPIETGAKRGRRIAVAQVGIDLASAELDERKRQLLYDVQTHYAEAITARERVATLEKILQNNQENYRLTSARVEKGDVAPLERQLLSVELKRTEAQRAIYAARGTSSLLELKRVVGLRADEPAEPVTPIDAPERISGLEELKARAIANRPDLRLAELAEKQAAAEAALGRANASPDLTLSAQYSRRNSKFDALGISSSTGATVPLQDQSNLLVLGLSIPIMTKNRTRGEVEAAIARESAARIRSEFLRKNIATDVEAAYTRWQGARTAKETLRTGVLDQSAENVSVIQQAYRLGQLRLLDVLNEQRRLLDSQLAYIDAVNEEYQAFAELERAVGGNLR